MKNKGYSLLLLVPILFVTMVLTSCKFMTPSDYKKAKEVVSSELAQVGLHGKVSITQLSWTALEYPQYHVTYTYSEKTYDDQMVRLEDETTFKDDWSLNSLIFLEYKEAFLEQKSIKELEDKIEEQLKKQSLGLPINFFSFLGNFYPDEKEAILDSIAKQNLKEGKKDFAGYYQIPLQTLIDQELVRMTIFVDDSASVTTDQDLKKAAKKLDASKLPNGAYRFYYSKGGGAKSIGYSFKVKDGKVVFYEDQKDELEDQN